MQPVEPVVFRRRNLARVYAHGLVFYCLKADIFFGPSTDSEPWRRNGPERPVGT